MILMQNDSFVLVRQSSHTSAKLGEMLRQITAKKIHHEQNGFFFFSKIPHRHLKSHQLPFVEHTLILIHSENGKKELP